MIKTFTFEEGEIPAEEIFNTIISERIRPRNIQEVERLNLILQETSRILSIIIRDTNNQVLLLKINRATAISSQYLDINSIKRTGLNLGTYDWQIHHDRFAKIRHEIGTRYFL